MSANRLHSTRVAWLVTVKVDLSHRMLVTSMSLRDCVFLYDTIGGCGKITLSSGWFWIKYQFFNSISLTFGAAGLPVFGNKWQNPIFLRVLRFCCKAALLLKSSLQPRCC